MDFQKIQNQIFRLVSYDSSSVADHLAIARELNNYRSSQPDYFRKVRVAFLSNFTLLGLPEVFKVRAMAHNIWADTYLGAYNQYTQEILNPESRFYKFQPRLVYFLIDSTDANEDQINKLANVLRDKGIAVKIVWGGVIKEKFTDHWHTKFKELGDLRLAPQAFPDFADQELIGEVVAISGATKKCLVVDLDNTLWGGVVGEDGWEKVTPNRELQSHIMGLYKQGVVLAINSKNNEPDAWEVLDKHPEMILRKDHFAARRINWRDKVANMIELAQELNLGLDSFVFVDDDPFQQEAVRQALPMVTVMSPYFLKSYAGFCNFNITPEDVQRGQMYAEEKQRRETRVSLGSVEDFLRELNMEVTIRPAHDSSIARIAQLTQKTNQFNLTTRRYLEQDINRFIKSGWRVWSVSAKDKFGDYGIIGVGIVEPKGLTWRIDTFLFSCRILGRAVERAFLTHIINQARAYDVRAIEGDFIPTTKNESCKSFYGANGFNAVSGDKKGELYHYNITDSPSLDYPEFLKVVSV